MYFFILSLSWTVTPWSIKTISIFTGISARELNMMGGSGSMP